MPTSPCSHPGVVWEPVEIEYKPDGTASVWQEGFCRDCRRYVLLTYEQCEVGEDDSRAVRTIPVGKS
jgi:hypothetical protein